MEETNVKSKCIRFAVFCEPYIKLSTGMWKHRSTFMSGEKNEFTLDELYDKFLLTEPKETR